MKVKVELVVARYKGKVVFAEAVNDHYTYIQVVIKRDEIDNDVFVKLLEGLGSFETASEVNIGEHEAKDCVREVGDLKIDIEEHTVELDKVSKI